MKSITVAFAAILLSTGMSFAEVQSVEKLIKPSISFTKAMEIATGSQNGDLVALELDHFGKTAVYVAELESETSHTIMQIDGTNGAIIATAKASANSPEALHDLMEELDHESEEDHDDVHDDCKMN
jgi:hypothetical protein